MTAESTPHNELVVVVAAQNTAAAPAVVEIEEEHWRHTNQLARLIRWLTSAITHANPHTRTARKCATLLNLRLIAAIQFTDREDGSNFS